MLHSVPRLPRSNTFVRICMYANLVRDEVYLNRHKRV